MHVYKVSPLLLSGRFEQKFYSVTELACYNQIYYITQCVFQTFKEFGFFFPTMNGHQALPAC